MGRRRSFAWERIVLCTVGVFLTVRFFAEYFWIAVFFSAAAILPLAWLGVGVWRERRKHERAKEEREAAVRRQEETRREACRKARYGREERERVEAHIRRALGPIAEWDLEEGAELLRLDAALIPPTEDLPFVEFACEEGVFFAASHDEEIMRELALGLSGLLRDRPAEARRLLY